MTVKVSRADRTKGKGAPCPASRTRDRMSMIYGLKREAGLHEVWGTERKRSCWVRRTRRYVNLIQDPMPYALLLTLTEDSPVARKCSAASIVELAL